MSVHITSAVWKHSRARGTALLVLLKIADQANDDGYTWLKVTTIAADPHDPDPERRKPGCRIDERTVSRHLKTLRGCPTKCPQERTPHVHADAELDLIERHGTSHIYRVRPGGHYAVAGKLLAVGVHELGDLEHLPPNIAAAILDAMNPRQSAAPDPRQSAGTPPTERRDPPDTHDGGPPADSPASQVREPSQDPTRVPLPADLTDNGGDLELLDDARLAIGVLQPWQGVTPATLGMTPTGDCARAGCNRGAHHDGPHYDPWFEAVGIALQEPTPTDTTAALWAQIARRAEDTGRAPEDIIRAAAIIVQEWGQAKLTAGSLKKHLDWALSPNREIDETQVSEYITASTRQRRVAVAVQSARQQLTEGPHE